MLLFLTGEAMDIEQRLESDVFIRGSGRRELRLLGGPGSCTALEAQLASLEQELQHLQRIQPEPDWTEYQRQQHARRLYETQTAILQTTEELQDCRSDLTIVGVERTQGIQYFSFNGQGSGYAADNSVPLIAQRTLVLRVYVNSKRAQRPGNNIPVLISGRVTVERVGEHSISPVAVLEPINGPISARSASAINRGNPDHTLNFRLSAADCQGLLSFLVEIFASEQVLAPPSALAGSTEITGSPGITTAPSFGFAELCESVPTFRIRALLIHYTGHGMDVAAPTGLDFAKTCEFIIKTYPIGRMDFAGCIEVEFNGDLGAPGGGCGPGWEGLLQLLRDTMDSSDDNDIYVALVPGGAFSPGTAGCGNTGVAAAFAGSGAVLAQEVGHAFHRKHAPSGGAGGPDPNYPTYDHYPSGSIGEFGFDCFTSRVYDPVSTYDFMGYDSPDWVSPYTYLGLRAAMIERFGAQAAMRADEAPLCETLHLRFRLHRDRTIEVLPSFHLPATVHQADRDPVVDISCELLDSKGEVLDFHRCHDRQPHQDPDGPYVDFTEPLRWVAETTSIRFLQGKEVLHVHVIEDVAPDIDVNKAKLVYGETPVRIRWKANHPQRTASEIRYMVRHSENGGQTWHTIASGMQGSSCWISPQWLPAGEGCCLQIVASSGIRTSVVQGPSFARSPNPRTAYIISPDTMAEFPEGASVVLRGGAISPDFGLGEMTDTTWSSSLDGMIGRGFELAAEGLSNGTHVITLTTADGMGGAASTSISIRIGR
jgi:hypothetical protein